MYSIRTFSERGVEKNEILGDTYQVFRLDPNIPLNEGQNKGIIEAYKSYHNVEDCALREEISIFVVSETKFILLSCGEVAYIVSPTGSTYSKLVG